MAKNNDTDRHVPDHRGSMKIIMIVLLIWGGSTGYKTVQIYAETQQYVQMQADLEEQIEEAQAEQTAIQAQADYQNSDEYIEELAREKFGLIYENEIIFKKQGR